jgi:hypothetical protein
MRAFFNLLDDLLAALAIAGAVAMPALALSAALDWMIHPFPG